MWRAIGERGVGLNVVEVGVDNSASELRMESIISKGGAEEYGCGGGGEGSEARDEPLVEGGK